MPQVPAHPSFTPPPVVRRRLSNGIVVLIAESQRLPILTIRLVVRGGENLAPAASYGLAEMTAALLEEATRSRDSMKLAGEISEIGATLGSDGGVEVCSLFLSTLTKHEDKALELFSDVLLHPAFPEKDLQRLRKQRAAALLRRRDLAPVIANVVFGKLLYGSGHPYGRIATPESINRITRDQVRRFYEQVFLPNNAAIIVVGAVTADEITAKLQRALREWKPGSLPDLKYPGPPPSGPMALYLVDKPAAAQSVLTVGHVGVSRLTPDYFPLLVLNGALGGQFSSRINLNLREDKGYTYGARSSFNFRQGPGPFSAGASVQTAVTKEALVELLRELKDIAGQRPLSDSELAFAKDRLKKGYPSRFETTASRASALSELAEFHLSDDYFTTYQSRIEAVTKEDTKRVARKYFDPDHMTIVIVGDRKAIEPKLKELPFAQVVHVLDSEGNPLASDTKTNAGAGQ
jgi:zinc protease